MLQESPQCVNTYTSLRVEALVAMEFVQTAFPRVLEDAQSYALATALADPIPTRLAVTY